MVSYRAFDGISVHEAVLMHMRAELQERTGM
jgi:hypothetical protein